MMATIWKYAVDFDGEFELAMPKGAKILNFATVGQNSGAIWALVDPTAEPVIRHFGLCGTGNPWPENAEYIGTSQFMGGRLVFHLFEEPPQ